MSEKELDLLDGKEFMLWKLSRIVRYEGMVLREGATCTDPKMKLEQLEVLSQVKKFLDSYDTNIRILEQAHRPISQAQMNYIEQEDMGYDGR